MTPASEILAHFRNCGKRVVSFAGFGELGYREPEVVERIGRRVLEPLRPEDVLVNAGTLLRERGEDGIAAIYPLAKALGFETRGVYPGIALAFADTHRVSPYVDRYFYVDDPSWGGFRDDLRAPSATLEVILEVTDELVLIGGGRHAADELGAFLDRGLPVRYFPAAMNPGAASRWSRTSGVALDDPHGEARRVWLRKRPARKDRAPD